MVSVALHVPFKNEFSLGETGGALLLVERSDVRVVPEPTVTGLPCDLGKDLQVHQTLHDLIGASERGSDSAPAHLSRS